MNVALISVLPQTVIKVEVRVKVSFDGEIESIGSEEGLHVRSEIELAVVQH